MEAVCIRECTIPGRGLVEVGVKLVVTDAAAPWLKHFKVQGLPDADPAPAVAPAPQAEEAPAVAPAHQARRGGRQKKKA